MGTPAQSQSLILEEQRKRVENAINTMIMDTYSTHLRRMQGEMHNCAVGCCNDTKKQPTMDNVQNCIDECALPLLKAQDYMQHELGQFQIGLQRCVTECGDTIRNKIPQDTSEDDMVRYRNQFEQCTVKCVDKHIGLIPSMMKAVKTVLAKGSTNYRPT